MVFYKRLAKIYEIFDKDNNLFIKIVGQTNIYEKNANNIFYNVVYKRRSIRII